MALANLMAPSWYFGKVRSLAGVPVHSPPERPQRLNLAGQYPDAGESHHGAAGAKGQMRAA
jgi:hypothetical protein